MPRQVNDDPELLEQMLNDAGSIPDIFKTTNYWSAYERLFVSELRSEGLKNFRCRRSSVLQSFGAVDLLPWSQYLYPNPIYKIGFKTRLINSLLGPLMGLKSIQRLANYVAFVTIGTTLEDIRILCYEFAKSYGENVGAKSICELEASLYGNPEDLFQINGKNYTMSTIYYYMQYAYCCQFMDFESIDAMIEIGCGSGKQIEIIKKLHPHIKFLIFEIPPQLYVCEQYLSAVFPGSVISYKNNRVVRELPEMQDGNIFIFGNWQLPDLNLHCDLFWNSASFQEMEPNVVLNYLKYINRITDKYIFLHELMEGQTQAKKEGQLGVLEQTKLEDYKQGLTDFQLENISKSFFIPRASIASNTTYRYTFWTRR